MQHPTGFRLLFLVLALSTGHAALAQPVHWEMLENAPTVLRFRHDDIRMVTPDRGWVVNQAGQIWRTEDAGDTWTEQVNVAGMAFRTVAATNDSTAFVGTILTPGNVLFATRDRGETWTDITADITGPTVAAICGLWTVNDSTVVGVGAFYGESRIIRTTDNGVTWAAVDSQPLAETLVDVFFFDDGVGFATGGNSEILEGTTVVLKTTDGGLTWENVFEGTPTPGVRGSWGWKFSFPSRDVGYLAVEYADNTENQPAKYLKTVDGGDTWTEHFIPGSVSHAGLQSAGFITEDIGWMSGRGVTSMTVDGGETWRQLDHWIRTFPQGQLDGSVNRFHMVNDTFAVAVGQRVHRLMPMRAATAIEAAEAPSPVFSITDSYPNPFRERSTFRLVLEEPAFVRVQVIDMTGRRLGVLLSGQLDTGTHSVEWDGRSSGGERLASGLYMYIIDVGDSREIKRVVRLQ